MVQRAHFKCPDATGTTMKISELLQRPTGYLPFAFSAAALVTIAVHVAIAGTEPQTDEGAAAHVWQVLMVFNFFVVGLFAFLWLPKAPRPAMLVLVLQVVGIAAAM